jgi:hypothetical protein
MFPVMAQLRPPVPGGLPPTPGSQFIPIEGVSNQLADATVNAVAQAWDQTWNNVFSGPLYGILSRLGLMIAGFVIIFFVFQFAKNMLEDASNRPLSELIWPLVVVVFLSNNGSLLGGLTVGMRNFINQENSQILQTTAAGLNAQAALNRIANFHSAQAKIGSLQTACDDIRDNTLLESCLKNVQQQANQIMSEIPIQELGGQWLQKLQAMAQAAVQNPLAAAINGATAVNSLTLRVQSIPALMIAQAILIAAQGAFQTLVEAAFLLTGLLGPIALGASLLPFGAKPIWAWLTSFWSVGLCKLSLNILTGLIAQTTYQTGPLDVGGLVLPIALGILSPILAMAMAAGGGMAIFNGLTSAATNIVSIVSYGLIRTK